jgi:hypothetical protein
VFEKGILQRKRKRKILFIFEQVQKGKVRFLFFERIQKGKVRFFIRRPAISGTTQ